MERDWGTAHLKKAEQQLPGGRQPNDGDAWGGAPSGGRPCPALCCSGLGTGSEGLFWETRSVNSRGTHGWMAAGRRAAGSEGHAQTAARGPRCGPEGTQTETRRASWGSLRNRCPPRLVSAGLGGCRARIWAGKGQSVRSGGTGCHAAGPPGLWEVRGGRRRPDGPGVPTGQRGQSSPLHAEQLSVAPSVFPSHLHKEGKKKAKRQPILSGLAVSPI